MRRCSIFPWKTATWDDVGHVSVSSCCHNKAEPLVIFEGNIGPGNLTCKCLSRGLIGRCRVNKDVAGIHATVVTRPKCYNLTDTIEVLIKGRQI